MDLRPYGLDLVLDPSTDLLTIDKSKVAIATLGRRKHKDDKYVLTVNGTPYEIMEIIGKGTYGILYSAKHKGKIYAIKEMFRIQNPYEFHSCVMEIIIHILLLHESMDQVNGPYVPYLYKMGYDFKRNKMYLVTELMDDTLGGYIEDVSKESNDVLVPFVLTRLATILEFFGNRLHFNHRDLHSGNIMLSADIQRVVIIDFGFACLTWKNLLVQVPSLKGPCFKVDRDLAFLIFGLFKKFSNFMSDSLVEALRKPLLTRVGNHTCDMGAMCPEYGLEKGDNHYNYLDRENVVAPYARWSKVRQQMVRRLAIARGSAKTLTPCTSDSVRNPKTRRCKKPSLTAKSPTRSRRAVVLSAKVLECANKPGFMYDVRTENCVPII